MECKSSITAKEQNISSEALNEKAGLDKEIKKIIDGNSACEEKKGDLKGVFVSKFKIGTALYLLSYRIVSDGIELITVGPHENYYRDLKSYMKNM